MDSIVNIREAHHTDKTAAPQPDLGKIKKGSQKAMQLSSIEEQIFYQICHQLQTPSAKVSSEKFSICLKLINKSTLLKKTNNMRGRSWNKSGRGKKEKTLITKGAVASMIRKS